MSYMLYHSRLQHLMAQFKYSERIKTILVYNKDFTTFKRVCYSRKEPNFVNRLCRECCTVYTTVQSPEISNFSKPLEAQKVN